MIQNQIVHFLKKAEGYISGEEISRQLKLSRAAIWKNIEELRGDGYEIEAVPHRGYRLVACADKLFPHEIQFNLGTKVLGKQVIHHDSISSTMDEAFELGVKGAAEGTVVCAENQTKGRGRLGRNWVSPKGKGIYLSLILRPLLTPTEVAQLTLLSAVAVSEAVKKICGVTTSIKWPNDLLINNKKVAGILMESSSQMDNVRFVVLGIGLNVNTTLSHLPPHSTSLKQETGKQISRVVLIQEILRHLEKWYDILKIKGFAPVLTKWKELSSTLGRRVRIVDSSGELEGEAIGLDAQGGLMIRSESGIAVKRMTGDVILI